MIPGLREKLGLPGDGPALQDLSPQVQMGIALARTKRPGETYAGTVPYAEVQHRRARNRVARESRRINRRAGSR